VGYGEVKGRLAELIVEHFAEARERRAALVAHPVRVSEVRAAAAERARKTAGIVLEHARQACGVSTR
jgi:tryptophanyl-tRNA synthetase